MSEKISKAVLHADVTQRRSVSIVTPCLNPGKRLIRCLDSVAAQTYTTVQHIIIDGGSTDGTVDLLRQRGVRFVSEPDRGQTHAINKGFALAEGDWLGWLNADDELTPLAIELALDAVRSSPEIGWVYGDNVLVREGGGHESKAAPAHVDAHTLENGNPIPQAGSLIARWALELVGPLDEELGLAMDYDLWLRLVHASVRSAYVPATLAAFELHKDSKSGRMPGSEFKLEWATSLLKNGQHRAAALMYGRAAASAAQREAGPIQRPRLEHEIGQIAERYADIDVKTLRAVAYAEAALLELHLRPRGFGYLLRPEAWRVAEMRGRLVRVLTRGVQRRITRP